MIVHEIRRHGDMEHQFAGLHNPERVALCARPTALHIHFRVNDVSDATGDAALVGEFVTVKITNSTTWALFGETET